MPLPLALVAVPAVIGLLGVKKGYDAYASRSEAKDLDATARSAVEKAQRRLESARSRCAEALGRLGELKLDVWNHQLGRFVLLFGKLRNVDLRGQARLDGLGAMRLTNEDLGEMKTYSRLASEVASGGATALGSGALAGFASFGGATMFASASTGTAISSLSGVAATNATLAWFGGGSLALGGAGMAGGMAVLGGIVAAPVLAVGGLILAAKARKSLAVAEVRHAQARKIATELDSATAAVDRIYAVATQFREMIIGLNGRFGRVLDELAVVMAESGVDYSKYSERERRAVHIALMFAQATKTILDTPILTEEGALAKASSERALVDGNRLLGLNAQTTSRG